MHPKETHRGWETLKGINERHLRDTRHLKDTKETPERQPTKVPNVAVCMMASLMQLTNFK